MLSRGFTPPSVELRLVDIWRRVLGQKEVSLDDDFFEIGGNSLSAAQVIVEIQSAFGRQLPLIVLHEAPTITRLARVIERQNGTRAWPTLVALQRLGSAPPFFCVHGAGGSILGLMDLARHLAPRQPLFGIQAPSCLTENASPRSIEELASDYVAALRAFQGEGPYYLGGYSFGGSVALEMAQQLRAAGHTVALLAILDHTPPPTRYRKVIWTPTLPLDFVANTARWVVQDIWRCGTSGRLVSLKRKWRIATLRIRNLLSRSRPASGKSDVAEIFADRIFPEPFQRLLVAHYQAMRNYAPRPYAGRVVLFRSRVRPLLRMHGRDLGWGELANGGLDVVTVPGNHETMLKPPNVEFLAKELLKRLPEVAPADSAHQ
jgi:thioesterase domain-containing protein/acyl carrier protein